MAYREAAIDCPTRSFPLSAAVAAVDLSGIATSRTDSAYRPQIFALRAAVYRLDATFFQCSYNFTLIVSSVAVNFATFA